MSYTPRFTCKTGEYLDRLFEIEDGHTVTVLAVRHQREDDYH